MDANRTDSRPSAESFDNVLALLDEERSRQLVEVIPTVTYTGAFQIVGRDDGLDPPTQLCAPCKRFMQQPPPTYSAQDLDKRSGLAPARFWMPHHDTLFQLIDCCHSRLGSCRLCQLLWHGIQRETSRARTPAIWWRQTEPAKIGWAEGGLKMSLRNHNDFTYCIGLNIPLKPMCGLSEHYYLRMVHKPNVEAVEVHPLLGGTTDSTSTFRQIVRWMDDCAENHEPCRIVEPSESRRPTRLIRIEYAAGTFRLATDFPSGTRYAAVSYRWGSAGACYMLTRETAEGMRDGASLSLLPRTLLDTCTIAHRLGLEYVWIDRLCIFQESRQDWAREASRMALIYKHVFLTISAACASRESQGCLRRRNAAGIQPLRLLSNPLLPPVRAPGLRESSYITSNEPRAEGGDDGGRLGHLADRGWVFQERILSQRIVHFSREQVYWECREREASEAWPRQVETFYGPSRPYVRHGSRKESGEEHSLWYEVVEKYSVRKLTYDEDKLPALSGLARETAEVRGESGDAYLTGLWRSTVLRDLCWNTCYQTPGVPERYLAPSWSWASLHTEISYTGSGSGFGYRPVVEFRDARLLLATVDPYGAVVDGWMHLFGRLKPVTVVVQPGVTAHQPRQRHPWPESVRDVDGTGLPFLEYAFAKLDIDSFATETSTSVPMFCLPVLKDRRGDPETEHRPEIYCLLLIPDGSIKHVRSEETLPSPQTPCADEYQRAGLARLYVRDWPAFKSWLAEDPERDVVIR